MPDATDFNSRAMTDGETSEAALRRLHDFGGIQRFLHAARTNLTFAILKFRTASNRKRRWSSSFRMALAGRSCLAFPFGTALPVFTRMAPGRESIAWLLETHAAPQPQAPHARSVLSAGCYFLACQSSTNPPTSGSFTTTARPSGVFTIPPSEIVVAPPAFTLA